MKQIKLSDSLGRFYHSGGVVQYVAFQLDPNESPNYTEINHQAIEAVLEHEGYRGEDIASSQADKATNQPITLEQFMGPYYNFESRHLLTREEMRKQPAPNDLYSNYISKGYASVFSQPPYGLRLNQVETEDLFNELNQSLFGDYKDDLEILQWSTDWSPFFVVGEEWWGSYWWTIHNKTKHQVLVIGASSTD